MPYTDEQRKAIETRGSVYVSAGAGSGKTSVLTRRVIERVLDKNEPVDANRFLILTFTNAAAAELKSRLVRAVEDEIKKEPDDRRLRRQRLLIRRADIMTMDAFCSALVREYFTELDIAPDCRVGDRGSLARLEREALSAALEKSYADDADFRSFASLFGRARSDADAARAVKKLYGVTRAFPDVEGWLERELAACSGGLQQNATPAGAFMLLEAAKTAASMRDMYSRALRACAGTDVELFYAPALEALRGIAVMSLEQCNAGDRASAVETISRRSTVRLKPYKGQNRALAEYVSDIKKNAGALAQSIERMLGESEERVAADNARVYPMMRAWFDCMRDYGERLFELKKRRKMFDFYDIERMALELLQKGDGSPSEIAREVSSRYEEVMVDEYQDTNELQSRMYELLSDGRRKLFAVGDVKQSIYRFRDARPDIFTALLDEAGETQNPVFAPLNRNFRSKKRVIEGINQIFSHIMSRETGGVDYAGHLLVPNDESDDGGVELRLVEKLSDDNAEAEEVANIVEGELAAGRQPQDICILMRSRKRMGDFAAALRARGISAALFSADSLSHTYEVRLLTSFLRAADNPLSDIDISACLLSPVCGRDADFLANLAGERKGGSLWGRLKERSDEPLAVMLESIRRSAARSGAAGAVGTAIFDTGLFDAVGAMESGERRMRNLRRMMAAAEENGGSLTAFLRALENSDMRMSGGTSEDSVLITTVHGSKGLEWPVVIFADNGARFNKEDLNEKILITGQGVGMQLSDTEGRYFPTLGYTAARQRENNAICSENVRVLYVALTRAKDMLYITGSVKDMRGFMAKSLDVVSGRAPDAIAMRSADSPLRWFVGALADNEGCGALRAYLPEANIEVIEGGCVTASIRAAGDRPKTQTESREWCEPDEGLLKELYRRADFVYPHAALAGVPAKLSVSELTKSESVLLREPSFAEGAASGAQRGSAMHLYMQCSDYARAAESFSGELARLVAEGYLSPRQAEIIDVNEGERFFKSPLYERIARAKQVLREYPFISSIPACRLVPGTGDEKIMVQGIADCIIIESDGAVIVDYKTDRVRSMEELRERYAPQVVFYAEAIGIRLGIPVKQTLLYSFCLDKIIDVDKDETAW